MKFIKFLNEREDYSAGITFFDVDDTILKTDAKVSIISRDGKVVKRLGNHDYLSYVPKEGETAFFGEYIDSKRFEETSQPVIKTIERIKRIFKNIEHHRGSKVVILTGRSDMNDKDAFLNTFRKYGIPIDNIYIERIGNIPGATNDLPAAKVKIAMKYLKTGNFRRARLIDDSFHNCRAFAQMEDKLPEELLDKMRKRYNLDKNTKPITLYALQVMPDGELKPVEK